MALSDYDTLALDETGQPTNGVFTSPLGVTVEFYKNWLYIRDPALQKPKGGAYDFARDTVMSVNSGHLHYRDVEIFAERSSDRTKVFAVVKSGHEFQEFTDKAGVTHPASVETGMVGIARLGYVYPPPNPAHYPPPPPTASRADRRSAREWARYQWPYQWEDGILRPNRDARPEPTWEGVTAEDITTLRRLVRRLARNWDIAKKWTRLDFNNALRFNQGDAFLMGAHGVEIGAAATKVGAADEPLLVQAVRQQPVQEDTNG